MAESLTRPGISNPLPPVEAGKKYVEYMGGSDAILARARKDFDKGEFRFVAQALSHLVFAEPENEKARAMLADTLEQLSIGYLADTGCWSDNMAESLVDVGARRAQSGGESREYSGGAGDAARGSRL